MIIFLFIKSTIINSDLNTNPRILIHCQYVYGIGHLVRTAELARGLSKQFQVIILNGGESVPGFDLPEGVKFIQLPAIYKEERSEHLIPVDVNLTLNECFLKREEIIKQVVKEIKPDILITEHFPFGLLFEAEVLALISKAKSVNSAVKVVSSVRDVIESDEGGERDTYCCNLINTWYDMVLVHGDKEFAPLSISFPKIDQIKKPIIHTGYIVRSIKSVEKSKNSFNIIGSIAGGRLGSELLEAIIDSHLEVVSKKAHKLILFSGAFQEDFKKQRDKVASLRSDSIELHLFNSQQYLKCLTNASLVISLGGYNSIIESVASKKPMLVYQREFVGGNKEQNLRIELFERAGHLEIIRSEDLNVQKLSGLILTKIDRLNVPECELDMNGVQNSVKNLIDLLNTKN